MLCVLIRIASETHFTQFDWLKDKFYNSIKSRARSVFLLPSQKIDNFGSICKILITKLELLGMNYYFCGLCRHKSSGESLTNFTQ